MPVIKTGNQEWDQNLNTLGSALFPDPSKVAHGYYYGSEARKAQLESNRLIDQQNYRSRVGMMTQGGPQPGPLTFQQPQNVPGAAPIAAPPSNIPMAGAASQLSAVAGMTPAQGAAAAPAVITPHTYGTPAPVGPPSAVSGPAPQTTGSDGSVPSNDPTSGVLMAGSITAPDGGRKQSGPAAANGSPAPMPPGMTMPGLMALSAAGGLAGLDAATVQNSTQALAYELYSQGRIGRDQYHQMLGATGSPTLATADTSAASAANVANINAASALATTRTTQAGETGRKGMDLTYVPDPGGDPAKGKFVPLSQLQGMGGTPAYNPAAVTAAVAPVTVQPGGPGTASYSQPAFRAQQPQPGAPGQPPQPGMPTYQAGTEDIRQQQLGAVQNYVDPKNPTVLIPGTVEEARQNGWWSVPKTPEEWNGLAAYASANAPPDQAQKIRERVLAFATTTTPKPVTAEETNKEQILLDSQLAKHLPVPAGVYVKEPWFTNKYPAGASPALGGVLSDLTDQYFRYDPETKGNQVTSANKAIKQLIEEKRINPDQGRTTGWISDEKTLNKTVLTKEGPQQVPHFRVDLLDETGKPVKEGSPIPRILMRRMATTMAPGPAGSTPRGPAPLVTGRPTAGAPTAVPAPTPTASPTAPPAAAAPGTVLGPAPGQPEGHTGTINGGGRAVVRGGNWVAQ